MFLCYNINTQRKSIKLWREKTWDLFVELIVQSVSSPAPVQAVRKPTVLPLGGRALLRGAAGKVGTHCRS